MTVHVAAIEPSPIEIDARRCRLCGLKIDRHDMVDDGEGPEFFCRDFLPDEMTLEELERRAELVQQIEIAAILERMEWPAFVPPPPRAPEPYRPAQASVDAFFYLVRSDDVERLKSWLADHQRDAPFVLKLYEDKNART